MNERLLKYTIYAGLALVSLVMTNAGPGGIIITGIALLVIASTGESENEK